MDEFRGIHMYLFLMLLLHFTGAATGFMFFFRTVRDGEEVTLSCDDDMYGQNNCDNTTWWFPAGGKAEDKLDRLKVTEKCSLVIKKVTEDDAGRYICRWLRSGHEQITIVGVSVVTMTEQQDSDEVMLTCSVRTKHCGHTVKWLFSGRDIDEDNRDVKTLRSNCSASVTLKASHHINTSKSTSLTCEVADGIKVQQFPFRLGPSAAAESAPTGGNSSEAGNTTTASGVTDASTKPQSWWRFIMVSVGLSTLIITVVAVNVWTRIKEKKTQTDEITVHCDADDDSVNYENIPSPDGV